MMEKVRKTRRWILTMKLVIDTNIVFSAILNPASPIGQIILNGSKYFYFLSIGSIKEWDWQTRE
jgi:hypothetical protein